MIVLASIGTISTAQTCNLPTPPKGATVIDRDVYSVPDADLSLYSILYTLNGKGYIVSYQILNVMVDENKCPVRTEKLFSWEVEFCTKNKLTANHMLLTGHDGDLGQLEFNLRFWIWNTASYDYFYAYDAEMLYNVTSGNKELFCD
jgi:homogentisate 1,2-dioxygenase